MLNELQMDLLNDLIMLKASEETCEAVISFLKTDEQINQFYQMLTTTYKKRGKVTEEGMLKMVIMITCPKKSDTQ